MIIAFSNKKLRKISILKKMNLKIFTPITGREAKKATSIVIKTIKRAYKIIFDFKENLLAHSIYDSITYVLSISKAKAKVFE